VGERERREGDRKYKRKKGGKRDGDAKENIHHCISMGLF
jgi:hypothetical protein